MKILVDINHPAHVHLFRNAIQILKTKGHDVLITAREKDVTTHLLDLYNLPFRGTAKQRYGLLALPLGVLELDWKVFKLAKTFRPNLLVGTSFAITHIARLVGGKSVFFSEDNFESDRLTWLITRPFADHIVTPEALGDDFGKKHITYPGYQELAYLHPNRFTPNPNVLIEQGLEIDQPFSLIRFVSLKASHDIGQRGLSQTAKQKLLEIMIKKGPVIISSEEELPERYSRYRLRIEAHKMHDLMAFAQLLVSDSQTMTIEAAMLGVPSVRCNTFVGRTPVIEELEHKYQLTFGFLPQNEEAMLRKTEDILNSPSVHQEWEERKTNMLNDHIDLTAWMVDLFERLGEGNP